MEFINAYRYLKAECEENKVRFFSVLPTDSRRDNGNYIETPVFQFNL